MDAPPAIGIFGGTFDPVHYGHLRAASEAREKLHIEDFRLLPAGFPPHRSRTFASPEHRLAMLKLAVEQHADLIVDDREVRRSGRSYMVDTLAEIRGEESHAPILLMVGQDAVNHLDTWHQWHRLFELSHLVIMRRPGSGHEYSGRLFEELQKRVVTDAGALLESPAGSILPLEVTQLEISSTDIRGQIAAKCSPRFLLPDAVLDYIVTHQLYAHS